jgi:hypothetical protein
MCILCAKARETLYLLVRAGKHKPVYDPSVMCGDVVVVVNCKDIAVRLCMVGEG